MGASFSGRTLGERADGPALVEARAAGGDAAGWAEAHRPEVESLLEERRALLIRGLPVTDVGGFQSLLTALGARLLDYVERSTPRSRLAGRVFTSTEYPASEEIPLHNESSYSLEWPRRVFFCCLRPAARGGETSIADSRLVYDRVDAATRDSFLRRGVLYARNYGLGVDLTWQDAFQTDDAEELERHCARSDIEWTWLDRGRALRTRQVRPAALLHEPTGSRLWFNQAHLFHVSSLAPDLREAMTALFAPEELPRHAWYGDGGAIDDEPLEGVRRAYASARLLVAWEPGDVLLLDNLFYAHGRLPYSGARSVVVAMAGADAESTRPLLAADAVPAEGIS